MHDTKSHALFKPDDSLFVDKINLTMDDSVERLDKVSVVSLLTGLNKEQMEQQQNFRRSQDGYIAGGAFDDDPVVN